MEFTGEIIKNEGKAVIREFGKHATKCLWRV